MTIGYFAQEKARKVVKAAYLSSDAYLQGGWGEEIIEAFSKNEELNLLDRLFQEIPVPEFKYIQPEWYRKTVNSEEDDLYPDYAYVLRGNILFIYKVGRLLFRVTKETAEVWLHVIHNLKRFKLTYLYDAKKLCYNWAGIGAMYRTLQNKIESGIKYATLSGELKSEDFEPSLLSDDHLMDVSYSSKHPAYVKMWEKGCHSVKFIVFYDYGMWQVSLQLPFYRIEIFKLFSSEKKAVEAIRELLREKEEDMESFSEICSFVSKAQEWCEKGIIKLGTVGEWLERRKEKKPWYLCGSELEPRKIVVRISENIYRKQKR